MTSLEDFGARRWPPLREIVRDDQGSVICPVDGTPIDYSYGRIDVPVVRLVDEEFRDAFDNDVETVRSFGYRSPSDVLIPEIIDGPYASGYSSRWVGVRAEYTIGEHWIPVRSADLPAIERDFGDNTDDDRRTDVANWVEDDCDVYIGRATDGDGGEIHLLNADVGQRGWLGNPYPAEQYGRDEAVSMFMNALLLELEQRPALRTALVERCRGKTLGCLCGCANSDEKRCHGEVIVRIVDDLLVRLEDGGRE